MVERVCVSVYVIDSGFGWQMCFSSTFYDCWHNSHFFLSFIILYCPEFLIVCIISKYIKSFLSFSDCWHYFIPILFFLSIHQVHVIDTLLNFRIILSHTVFHRFFGLPSWLGLFSLMILFFEPFFFLSKILTCSLQKGIESPAHPST